MRYADLPYALLGQIARLVDILEVLPLENSALSDYIWQMTEPHTASVFDIADETAEARAIAEARAQAAAGDTISLADMMLWLESWGTENELPPPPWK